jgi:hypothetical protein
MPCLGAVARAHTPRPSVTGRSPWRSAPRGLDTRSRPSRRGDPQAVRHGVRELQGPSGSHGGMDLLRPFRPARAPAEVAASIEPFIGAMGVKLNRLGKLGLNSPTRAFVQRHVVAALLERLEGRLDGGRALELGCGRGVGGEIILDRFGAAELELLDIDPDMVERARDRLAGRARTRVVVGARSTRCRRGPMPWPRSIACSGRAGASSSRRWRARFFAGPFASRSRAGLPRTPVLSRARPTWPSLKRAPFTSTPGSRPGDSSCRRRRSQRASSGISSVWQSDVDRLADDQGSCALQTFANPRPGERSCRWRSGRLART